MLPLLFLTNGSAANAGGVINPAWPGLPVVPIPDGWTAIGSVGSWGNGRSEVARARQWVKIPAQAAAVPTLNDPNKTFPADDPQGRSDLQTLHAHLFLSSPADAKHGYGIGLPATVRTVAFGMIPVEVGLQLEQLRDRNDLPVALQLSFAQTVYHLPQEVRPGTFARTRWDSSITGAVRVRLTHLSIDGIDVGLGDCVSPPIELDVVGNPWWKTDPLTDPTAVGLETGSTAETTWRAERGNGSPNGGGITGELEIPAFSDCRGTTGEDLAPLLTGAVSGPGNAVTIGWAAMAGTGMTAEQKCGTFFRGTSIMGPRGPFLGDPSDCHPGYGPPVLDYPTRTD